MGHDEREEVRLYIIILGLISITIFLFPKNDDNDLEVVVGRTTNPLEQKEKEVVKESEILRLVKRLKIIRPDVYSNLSTLKLLKMEEINLSSGFLKIEDILLLEKIRSLKTLNLMMSNLTDKFSKSLEGLETVENLYLSNTQITDRAISSLVKMKSLNQLHIIGTKISPLGLQRLKKALPNCVVVYTNEEAMKLINEENETVSSSDDSREFDRRTLYGFKRQLEIVENRIGQAKKAGAEDEELQSLEGERLKWQSRIKELEAKRN